LVREFFNYPYKRDKDLCQDRPGGKEERMTEIENVIKVIELSTGYVRVETVRSWAQMPKKVWEELLPGEHVPNLWVGDSENHWIVK
jgi:hypothetical protein